MIKKQRKILWAIVVAVRLSVTHVCSGQKAAFPASIYLYHLVGQSPA